MSLDLVRDYINMTMAYPPLARPHVSLRSQIIQISSSCVCNKYPERHADLICAVVNLLYMGLGRG
jgi:hypothetical protein